LLTGWRDYRSLPARQALVSKVKQLNVSPRKRTISARKVAKYSKGQDDRIGRGQRVSEHRCATETKTLTFDGNTSVINARAEALPMAGSCSCFEMPEFVVQRDSMSPKHVLAFFDR
jgi:hypothetical protein